MLVRSVRRTIQTLLMAALLGAVTALLSVPARAASDPAFAAFLAGLWPEAQALGISRATFDQATRGLTPDLTLPDLDLPSRPAPPPGQPEFVKSPAEYLSEVSFTRLADKGRKLAAEHRATLSAIEARFGVPAHVVLAIWGRETGFGGYRLPHNALRVLATQAYAGRRKDQFRQEFLFALKMVEEGDAAIETMRSSWAGAMGMTQFLPSEFYKYGVDLDGDGHPNIFTSVPDALASAARQLKEKGWQTGKGWAHEVRAPRSLDCTRADPSVTQPVSAWVAQGFAPAYGRRIPAADLAEPASLLLPAGSYGPAFLILKNYYVIKDYNFSDLYVLFVGHLSERIADPRPFETPWGKVTQLAATQVEAMQRRLTDQGYYGEKVDGKAGMRTRLAVGAYQKANGLKVDCWPTAAVLAHMQGRAGVN
jgi:lytic murein transglycosylase